MYFLYFDETHWCKILFSCVLWNARGFPVTRFEKRPMSFKGWEHISSCGVISVKAEVNNKSKENNTTQNLRILKCCLQIFFLSPRAARLQRYFCLAGVFTLPQIMNCLNNKCPELWSEDSRLSSRYNVIRKDKRERKIKVRSRNGWFYSSGYFFSVMLWQTSLGEEGRHTEALLLFIILYTIFYELKHVSVSFHLLIIESGAAKGNCCWLCNSSFMHFWCMTLAGKQQTNNASIRGIQEALFTFVPLYTFTGHFIVWFTMHQYFDSLDKSSI